MSLEDPPPEPDLSASPAELDSTIGGNASTTTSAVPSSPGSDPSPRFGGVVSSSYTLRGQGQRARSSSAGVRSMTAAMRRRRSLSAFGAELDNGASSGSSSDIEDAEQDSNEDDSGQDKPALDRSSTSPSAVINGVAGPARKKRKRRSSMVYMSTPSSAGGALASSAQGTTTLGPGFESPFGNSVRPSSSRLRSSGDQGAYRRARRMSEVSSSAVRLSASTAWNITEEEDSSSSRPAFTPVSARAFHTETDSTIASDPKGKGKGKAVDRTPARHYELPISHDPLDPLSSFQNKRLPPSVSTNTIVEHAINSSPPSSRTRPYSTHHHSPLRPAEPPDRGRRHDTPSSSDLRSVASLDSFASTSKSHVSSSIAGAQSKGLTTAAAAGTGSTASEEAQPSLQQLLESVDLTAALRLVQTLQTQQQQQTRPPAQLQQQTASPLSTFGTPVQAAADEVSFPVGTGFPTSSNRTLTPLDTQQANSDPRVTIAEPPSSQSLGSGSAGSPPSPPSATDAKEGAGGVGGKMNRRLSISVGLAAMKGKDKKAPKTTAGTGINGGSSMIQEKVLDERAAMSAYARSFEDQISRVHLSLLPATLRRAQNAAKYIALRYRPVFAALEAGQPPPHLIEVGRWREERDELERRQRALSNRNGHTGSSADRLGKNVAFGTSREDMASTADSEGGRSLQGRLSDAGSIGSGSAPVPPASNVTRELLSAYGPRRNAFAKIWEIYPDDLAEYVDSGGRVRTGTEARRHGGRLVAHATSAISAVAPSAINETGRSSSDKALLQAPIPAEKAQMPMARPVESRASSYEASPLSRSVESQHKFFSSPDARNESPPMQNTSSGHRHAASIAASTRSSLTSGGLQMESGLSGHASPRHRGSATAPSSPRMYTHGRDYMTGGPTSPLAYSHKPLPAVSAQQQSAGVKSNLSRRFDRMRGKSLHVGTDSEASDAATNGRRQIDALGLVKFDNGTGSGGIHSDPSDGEVRSAYAGHQSPTSPRRRPLLHQLSDQGTSPVSPVKRPTVHRSPTSVEVPKRQHFMDTEGYRSSGGEDGGGLSNMGPGRRRPGRRLLAAAWQGFKGTLDAYPPFDHHNGLVAGLGGHTHSSLTYSPVTRQPSAARRRRATLLTAEESDDDDDDKGAWREVLDIGDDEHVALNSTLRDLRKEMGRIETYISQVPATLVEYLDELDHQEKHTLSDFGISVKHSMPRLHGAIIAELPTVKRGANGHAAASNERRGREYATDASFSTSHSGSESDTDTSSELSASDRVVLPVSRQLKTRPPGLRPRQATISAAMLKVHGRLASDQYSSSSVNQASGAIGRPRSNTTAGPGLGFVPSSPARKRIDSLIGLERRVAELRRTEDRLEADAAMVAHSQQSIDDEINELVTAVDKVQRDIDKTQYQQLRMVEDRFFRLKTSLARPSPAIDTLWATLAGALMCIFWLSWLVVTFLRISPLAKLIAIAEALAETIKRKLQSKDYPTMQAQSGSSPYT